MRSVAGGLIPFYNDPVIVNVSTATPVITLPMAYTRERYFNLTPPIAAPRTLALSGASRGRAINVKFSIDAGIALTLPSNFVMSNGLFDNATKEYTPLDTGAYTLTAWYDGTTWNATIIGPDNV